MEDRKQAFVVQSRHRRMDWADPNVRSLSLSLIKVSLDRASSPSVLSATIHLEVYASFEFEPMLGAGEQLRELAVTTEQLLGFSAKDAGE